MYPKRDLIRLVKGEDGVNLDFTGKKPGRGAYICKNEACVKKCVSKKLIGKILSTQVPDEVYERIAEEYAEHQQNC
jgi:Predicted nucleic-acid-binding protein implicated in transcription termination